MKLDPSLQKFRFSHPMYGYGEGNNGAWRIPYPGSGRELFVISSDGMGWDHVSVSLPNRCPNWQEMCFVKDLFFGPEETVIQYHPPKSQYRNFHPYCLHMWRPQDQQIPLPDPLMVAPENFESNMVKEKTCKPHGFTNFQTGKSSTPSCSNSTSA